MTVEMLAGRGLAARRGDRVLFASLDFSLAAGDALLLTGPNGSGKTSLLRLLAGFGRPIAGVLTWQGKSVDQDLDAHRARLHYIGHQDALKPALTVLETLQFWQALAGAARDEDHVLDRHRLTSLASMPCRFLSSGQRRRLALARLDAWPSPLWLMDEPAVGLDQAALERLSARLREHRQAGGMVVLSTHQPLDLDDTITIRLDEFPPPEIGSAEIGSAEIEATAW